MSMKVTLGLGRIASASWVGVGLFSALVGTSGCGGSDLEKQVDALRTEITALRANTAAMTERIDALEMQNGALKTAPGPTGDASGPAPATDNPNAPPDLRVVHLAPADGAGTEEIDSGDAHVKIRSTPGGLVSEDVSGKQSPAGDGRPKEKIVDSDSDKAKSKPKKDAPKTNTLKKVTPPAGNTTKQAPAGATKPTPSPAP